MLKKDLDWCTRGQMMNPHPSPSRGPWYVSFVHQPVLCFSSNRRELLRLEANSCQETTLQHPSLREVDVSRKEYNDGRFLGFLSQKTMATSSDNVVGSDCNLVYPSTTSVACTR